MKRTIRRCWRFARVAAHVCVAAAKLGLFWTNWTSERRRCETKVWSAHALGLFGFRTVVRGEPIDAGNNPPIFVANHTSWLDVYAIMSIADVSFVAKQEVRFWPVVGALAERLGAIFIQRERRASLINCIGMIEERLKDGQPIGIFPEGTTTDGSMVLPFHPSLFEAAIRSGASIQPIAISYRRADGSPASEVAFVGDMTLLESFGQLADCRDCIVELTFLQPIEPAGRSRQWLADAAERAVRTHFAAAEACNRKRGAQSKILRAA